MLKLDDALLIEYAEGFFGYGTYAAPYWFIGMEEGGGEIAIKDVELRLDIWKTTRSEVWDIVQHHAAIGGSLWFSGRPPLQTTWNKLIRTLLSAKRDPLFVVSAAQTPHLLKDRTERVRSYQQASMARKDGETCLLELLPLPSQSTKHWLYADWSRLPQLANRDAYTAHYGASRARALKARVQEWKPAVVVLYGLGHRDWWEQIAGVSLQEAIPTPGESGTIFVLVTHPNTKGIRNEYFHEVGREIAAKQEVLMQAQAQ